MESEGFREFLVDLSRFYNTLDRHEYTNDINLVEGLSSTIEEYRECLVIFCDLARVLPSSPVTDEAVQCLQELLSLVQHKSSSLAAFLEQVEEDSCGKSVRTEPILYCVKTSSSLIPRRETFHFSLSFTAGSLYRFRVFVQNNFENALCLKGPYCVGEQTRSACGSSPAVFDYKIVSLIMQVDLLICILCYWAVPGPHGI